jgi:16S rRNA (uracil1498-N3)-methyltransferase
MMPFSGSGLRPGTANGGPAPGAGEGPQSGPPGPGRAGASATAPGTGGGDFAKPTPGRVRTRRNPAPWGAARESLPTYFITPDMLDGDRVVVTGPLYRHLAGSLRVRPGERLTLVQGPKVLAVRVTAVEAGSLTAEVTAAAPAPPEPVRLTLAAGLPKGRKFDDIVRQAVELGATRVVPVLTQRSVPRPSGYGGDGPDARAARIGAVALEAAQQSGRTRVPEVAPPMAFADFVRLRPEGRGVVLWEDEHAVGILEALAGAPAAATLFVGPEGGLAPEEVAALVQRGYRRARLGPHTLRSETACVAALAVAAAALWRAAPALTAGREGI